LMGFTGELDDFFGIAQHIANHIIQLGYTNFQRHHNHAKKDTQLCH